MLNQARNSPGLYDALSAYLSNPKKPVYGSCAGMILMAREDGVGGGKKPQKGLGAMEEMRVWRNAYGGGCGRKTAFCFSQLSLCFSLVTINIQ